MSFDYKEAWRKLVAPNYQMLDKEVIDFFEEVCKETADLSQNYNLDMPWPDDDSIKDGFEAMTDEDLAWTARLFNFWGHWGFDGQCRKSAGGNWKYANYCDQILRERCGVSNKSVDRGYGVQIHQGVVRITYSTSREWQWEEIAPATRSILEGVMAKWNVLRPENPQEGFEAMKKLFTPKDGKWAGWFDTDKFMQ